MVMFGKGLVLIAAMGGIIFLLFIKLLSFKGLRYDQEQAKQQRIMTPEQRIAERAEIARIEREEQSRLMQEQSLFYMHQEQVKRFFDAKLEIVRSITDAQNRISVIQAEIARTRIDGEMRMIEYGHKQRTDNNTQYDPENDPDLEAMRKAKIVHEEQLHEMIRLQEATKYEAERRLMDLDNEIRRLPGASIDNWVGHQLLESSAVDV
ncbi:hypothetical protein CCP2SC5_80030 [Azospirillaceae bacterium]